jgi:uncharacterized protein
VRGLIAAVLLACALLGVAAMSDSALYGALSGGSAWLVLVWAVFRLPSDTGALVADRKMLQQSTTQWLLTVALLCLPLWAYQQRPGVVWIVVGCFSLSGWVFLLARSSLWTLVWRRARRGLPSSAKRVRPDPSVSTQVVLTQMIVLPVLQFWAFPLPPGVRALVPTHKFALVAVIVLLCVGLLGLARRAMWRGLSAVQQVAGEAEVAVDADPEDAQCIQAVQISSQTAQLEQWAHAGQYQRVVDCLQADPALWVMLQEHGAKPLRRLLALACQHDNVELLRDLILLGADLNMGAEDRRFPLLSAVRDTLTGRPSIVAMLLANGADAKVVDAEGRTALHYAARYADLDVAAQLLDAGALLDVPDKEGKTPLYAACEGGNWRAAKYLLDRGAKSEWPGTEPALLGAASGEDDTAGVELLLRHKSRINAVGRFGRNALHEATLRGNLRIASALLAAGADADHPDQAGATPLMEAIRSGVDAVVALFRTARVDINRVDRYRRTPLVLACSTPRTNASIVSTLLGMGARSDVRDEHGLSALDHALQRGRWDLVRCIDPDRDLPAAISDDHLGEDATGETFERLRRAALADRVDLVRALLGDSPAQIARLSERLLLEEANGALPLSLRDWLIRQLPSEGVDRVLAHVMRIGESDLAAALMRLGGQPSGAGLLAGWLSQVLALPSRYRAAAALCAEMIERGADLHGGDAGIYPLHSLVRLGWTDLLRTALGRGCDPNTVDRAGFTALMIAATKGDLGSVEGLVKAGARTDLQCADGRTALGMALSAGRRELIDWLDWSRWPHPRRPLRAADLIDAARAGDLNAVRCLLACGFAVDQRDAKGSTALLHAAGSGELRIVQMLLNAGADAGVVAATGATALSAAIMRGHAEVVRELLTRQGVQSHRFDGGISPLMLAVALGRQEIAELLRAQGADVCECDDLGNSLLHYLARFGFSAREPQAVLRHWQSLLGTPVLGLINQVNRRGETALMVLLGADAPPQAFVCEAGITQQITLLVRHGAQLDGQTGSGASVLHLAAQRGALSLVDALLSLGAPRGLRDTIGRDASETALSKGYVDVAAALRTSSAPVSMARLLRQPEN